VSLQRYDTDNGQKIAEAFAEEHEELVNGKLAFARVANAGIQLAVQFRTAARKLSTSFDADPRNLQVYVLTDSFPIARTEEEAQPASAKRFQNPFTGIRQVALTGKLLVEAVAN
jgi:hypothetical protein